MPGSSIVKLFDHPLVLLVAFLKLKVLLLKSMHSLLLFARVYFASLHIVTESLDKLLSLLASYTLSFIFLLPPLFGGSYFSNEEFFDQLERLSILPVSLAADDFRE